MRVPKRKTTKRKKAKAKGKVVLKATPAMVRGGANAGNIGYTSELANAGVIRFKVKAKKKT